MNEKGKRGRKKLAEKSAQLSCYVGTGRCLAAAWPGRIRMGRVVGVGVGGSACVWCGAPHLLTEEFPGGSVDGQTLQTGPGRAAWREGHSEPGFVRFVLTPAHVGRNNNNNSQQEAYSTVLLQYVQAKQARARGETRGPALLSSIKAPCLVPKTFRFSKL